MSTKSPSSQRSAAQVLADDFLVARAKILELAATLDRIDRAEGDAQQLPQMKLLAEGLAILCDSEENKAARVQLLLSRQYDPNWQQSMSIGKRPSP